RELREAEDRERLPAIPVARDAVGRRDPGGSGRRRRHDQGGEERRPGDGRGDEAPQGDGREGARRGRRPGGEEVAGGVTQTLAPRLLPGTQCLGGSASSSSSRLMNEYREGGGSLADSACPGRSLGTRTARVDAPASARRMLRGERGITMTPLLLLLSVVSANKEPPGPPPTVAKDAK